MHDYLVCFLQCLPHDFALQTVFRQNAIFYKSKEDLKRMMVRAASIKITKKRNNKKKTVEQGKGTADHLMPHVVSRRYSVKLRFRAMLRVRIALLIHFCRWALYIASTDHLFFL